MRAAVRLRVVLLGCSNGALAIRMIAKVLLMLRSRWCGAAGCLMDLVVAVVLGLRVYVVAHSRPP
jgi:hypothetical protein